MKKIDQVATILVIIGAFNWGFIGLFGFDAIDFFCEVPVLNHFFYTLIGLAALFKVIYWITGNVVASFKESD
jgi:uncharacterized membrane protein YuzA (DUF378 family)